MATEEYHKEILRRRGEFIVFEKPDWFFVRLKNILQTLRNVRDEAQPQRNNSAANSMKGQEEFALSRGAARLGLQELPDRDTQLFGCRLVTQVIHPAAEIDELVRAQQARRGCGRCYFVDRQRSLQDA